MWFLNLFSEISAFITHALVIIGILLIAVASIPYVWNLVPAVGKLYKAEVYLIGIILLGFGLFREGELSTENEYKAKMAAKDAEIAAAKIESGKTSTIYVDRIVTKRIYIKQQAKTVTEYIDREITGPKNVQLGKEVITAHNAAATGDLTKLTPSTEVPTAEHNDLTNPPKTLMVPKK
jgi:hypothetical protein